MTLTNRPDDSARPLWPWVVGSATLAAIATATGAGPAGLLLAALPAATGWLLTRRRPAGIRRRHTEVATELPFAVDLTAACLRAGSPVDAALTAAGAAVGGELGDRLTRAAAEIRCGTAVGDALPPPDEIVDLTALGRALRRSGESGAALADGLAALAEDLREERHVTALTRVHRLGVWLVLPLTVCFLPAFVVAGLVPVVASAMGSVLHQF